MRKTLTGRDMGRGGEVRIQSDHHLAPEREQRAVGASVTHMRVCMHGSMRAHARARKDAHARMPSAQLVVQKMMIFKLNCDIRPKPRNPKPPTRSLVIFALAISRQFCSSPRTGTGFSTF
jgi:hypothetical protein